MVIESGDASGSIPVVTRPDRVGAASKKIDAVTERHALGLQAHADGPDVEHLGPRRGLPNANVGSSAAASLHREPRGARHETLRQSKLEIRAADGIPCVQLLERRFALLEITKRRQSLIAALADNLLGADTDGAALAKATVISPFVVEKTGTRVLDAQGLPVAGSATPHQRSTTQRPSA